MMSRIDTCSGIFLVVEQTNIAKHGSTNVLNNWQKWSSTCVTKTPEKLSQYENIWRTRLRPLSAHKING
jgi:hypothetical protein